MSASIGTVTTLQSAFADLWVEGAAAPAVLPRSTEDVMRVVAWCRDNGWRILPAGRGHTFGEQYHVPSGVLTLLSLAREGISDPDPRDLVLEVEAGVPASVAAAHVNDAGFRLDGWPEDYSGTVGGLVCGHLGPQIRAIVLGVDIVDGRGRSLRFGGRVRKNVSGFDIGGAFCGSQGAIGWLDRIYFRLTPSGAPLVARTALPPKTVPRNLTGRFLEVARALDPDDVFLKPGA